MPKKGTRKGGGGGGAGSGTGTKREAEKEKEEKEDENGRSAVGRNKSRMVRSLRMEENLTTA